MFKSYLNYILVYLNMFIWDYTTFVVFLVIYTIVYFILDNLHNEAFKTVESKIYTSLGVAILITLLYSYFMSSGTETLLSENFTEAASKFGEISGLTSLDPFANINL